MPMAVAMMPPSAIGVVDDAMLAVLALQSLGGPKHAAEIADVLAHQHHGRVLLEHDVHGGVQRLNHVHVGHGLAIPFGMHQGTLLLQVLGNILEYVLEHQIGIEPADPRSWCRRPSPPSNSMRPAPRVRPSTPE